MTWKQIEASRERRLWATQVCVPSVVALAYIFTRPDVVDQCKRIKEKAKDKFKFHKNKDKASK